jgi:uncharacterized protein YndB with AHSA1/START domain
MENAETGIKLTSKFLAPVALMWRVWTEPEYITQWWGPSGFTSTIHVMDVKEGGEWKLTLHGPDDRGYLNRSIYKEVIPLEKIVFEHFNPHFITKVLFTELENTTQVEWSLTFDSAEDKKIIVETFKADEGQKENFERLEAFISSLMK